MVVVAEVGEITSVGGGMPLADCVHAPVLQRCVVVVEVVEERLVTTVLLGEEMQNTLYKSVVRGPA